MNTVENTKLTQQAVPAILIAVVVILVLSASMSTLSSLVLASSSTLTLDFIKGNIIKDMDEKRQVKWMRGLVVVFIAISVVLALIQYKSSVTFIALGKGPAGHSCSPMESRTVTVTFLS